jgi:hypothetical protein
MKIKKIITIYLKDESKEQYLEGTTCKNIELFSDNSITITFKNGDKKTFVGVSCVIEEIK